MDTPSIVLWAASELLPTSCSLGRIKVRDVQMGAWGRAGRGRGGMNRAHRMSSSCKGTWHAGQRGALFHPGEERLGRLGVVTLDKIKGLTAKSERPETQSKLTKGTVAFSAKPQPGIVQEPSVPGLFPWIPEAQACVSDAPAVTHPGKKS